MRLKARGVAAALAVLATAVGLSSAKSADTYPSGPIKLVLPLGAGGATDNLARISSAPVEAKLGQPIVIENRPGAGGSLASALVAQSPPDGQTLLFANFATHAVTPTLFTNLTYDPVKDFKPVTLIASQPHLVLVNNDLPVKTLAELIDYAKQNPGKLNFASAGVGSPLHLAAEYFKLKTGTDLVHVPYKSSAPALLDLIAGRVQVFFDNVSTGLPYVQSGKVRALAITSAKRSPLAPDVPTAAEAGLPDFETYGWWGVAAPAKTPPEVVEKLSATYIAGLKTPEVADKLASQGYTVIASSPSEFEDYIKKEITKWEPVIKAAKLTPTN